MKILSFIIRLALIGAAVAFLNSCYCWGGGGGYYGGGGGGYHGGGGGYGGGGGGYCY